MVWTLRNADSFHPTLSLTLDNGSDDLVRTSPASCQSYILARLPPAVFVDPYTFPPSATQSSKGVQALTFLNSSSVEFRNVNFANVELEAAVGWSDREGVARRRSSAARAGAGAGRGSSSDGKQARRAIKQPGKDTYVVVVGQDNGEDDQSRELRATSESRRADARAPLAREQTAVLVALDSRLESRIERDGTVGGSTKNEKESDDDDDDDDDVDEQEALTGIKPSSSSKHLDKKASTVDIPLHVRYMPPSAASPSHLPSPSELLDRILNPGNSGFYQDVTLSKPDVLLACSSALPASLSQKWSSVEPDELLLPPHSHLTFPRQLATFKWYRLDVPLSPSHTSSTGLTLSIPQGDASLAAPVQHLTLCFFTAIALYLALSLHRILNSVAQTQAQWKKIQLGKTR